MLLNQLNKSKPLRTVNLLGLSVIFARKTTLNGWVFIVAGLFVLLLSVAAVSWQSLRAATMNPAKTLKNE